MNRFAEPRTTAEHGLDIVTASVPEAPRIFQIILAGKLATLPNVEIGLYRHHVYAEICGPEGELVGERTAEIEGKITAQDDNTRLLVARNRHTVYACSLLERASPGVVNISRFYVHSDAQGLGVGPEMMAAIDGWAEGAPQTLVTQKHNQPAQTFFGRQGFTAVEPYDGGETIAGIHVPRVRMTKPAS